MEISEVFDEKIVRIGDTLEQISSLNRRISFHKTHNGNDSTIKQYESMRADFVLELRDLLRSYNLDANIEVANDNP